MGTKLAILAGYALILLALGAVARRFSRRSAEDFFLAGRALGPLVLLATMAATNFSGFTVVGFSGAGYRLGFAFYPVMAYGTGLMALSFALIGIPAMRLGRLLGLITPPELIGARFQSRSLSVLFAVAMATFTLPYLAIQPMAAAYALGGLLGIPYTAGVALVVAVVLIYVLAGGMRSVVWTDVFQGIVMFAALAAAFVAVFRVAGGAGAYRLLALESREHFMRPGAGGGLPLGIWASYMLLWFLADPMFPQLFQRFYAARSERSIVWMMVLYPVVTAVLFFLPVALGVLGRGLLPGLSGKETDSVLPLLMDRYGGNLLSGLACAGLLAAIMSTMSSQLLTLGSIVERDLIGRRPTEGRPHEGAALSRSPRLAATRVSLAVLALVGLALALRPPATILAIATETFAGLAVLFPTVIAVLYWSRATAAGSIASIAVGEALVVLYHFKIPPAFGLLPAIPAVAASTLVLVFVCLLRPGGGDTRPREWRDAVRSGLPKRAVAAWSAVFALLFILSVDWWRFGDDPRLLWGLPSWLFYFAILALALTFAYALFSLQLLRRSPAQRRR